MSTAQQFVMIGQMSKEKMPPKERHLGESKDKDREKSTSGLRPSQRKVSLGVDLMLKQQKRETGIEPLKTQAFHFTKEADLSEWANEVLTHPSGSQTERGGRRREAPNRDDGSKTARGKGLTETVLTKSEWARLLYKGTPKLPKTLSRPLDKLSTQASYIPILHENSAQREQENRANYMIRQALGRKNNFSSHMDAGGEDALTEEREKNLGEETTAEEPHRSQLETFLRISSPKLDTIKQAFMERDGRLPPAEFVATLYENMPPEVQEEQGRLVGQLFDLFEQIDVKGEGTVSWEELISFMFECERLSSQDQLGAEAILRYNPSPVVDREVRGTDVVIEKIIYFPELDQICVCERGSKVLKLQRGSDLALASTIVGHNGQVLTALHVVEMDYIVSSASDACLMFWGAYTGNLRERIPCSSAQMALAWDRKRLQLYSGAAQTGEITVWDPKTMRSVRTFAAHEDSVSDLLIVEGMDALFSASLDSTIKLWDLSSSTLRGQLTGHNKGVYSLAYIPNQRYIVSAGFDHEIKVWNPLIDKVLYNLPHLDSVVGVISIDNTPRMISASVDGVFKMWDTRTFQCVQEVSPADDKDGETVRLDCIGYLPLRDRVVLGGKKMWALDYQQPVEPTLTDEHPIVAALFLSTICAVLTAAGRGIKLWDARTGRMIGAFNDVATSDITSMVVDDRQRKIVLGESNGRVAVYNRDNGALLHTLEPHGSDVSALAVCSLTKCVVSAGWDRLIKVQQESDGDRSVVLRSMRGHGADITCIAYSQPLALIASGSADGLVRVWDYEEGKLEGTCQGHRTEITALVFLDSLRALVTTDFVGSLCVWLCRPWASKYSLICRIANPSAQLHPTAQKTAAAISLSLDKAPLTTIFTGNEDGSINKLDVTKLVTELQSKGLPAVRKREASKHQRHGRVVVPVPAGVEAINLTGADLMGAMSHLGFVDPPTVPGMFTLSDDVISVKLNWQAHNDGIRSLQFIDDPCSLLSCSFDCRVCLWSLEGEKFGELHQGADVMGRGWRLPVDVEARRQREEKLQQERERELWSTLERKYNGGEEDGELDEDAPDEANRTAAFFLTQEAE